MATRVGWGKSLLAVFDSSTPKTPYRCKDLADRPISSGSRLIAHFVPNFVAMATWEGRGKISLAAFDGPVPKPPYRRKDFVDISSRSQKKSYSPFCPKFRCHGNHGESGVNWVDTVGLAITENHTVNQKF